MIVNLNKFDHAYSDVELTVRYVSMDHHLDGTSNLRTSRDYSLLPTIKTTTESTRLSSRIRPLSRCDKS